MPNIFFKKLGKSNILKVLDYILDLDTDFTVLDVCDGTKLSRKTIEKILNKFLKENLIIKTRLIARTQLYKFNLRNKLSKKLYEINKLILDEQELKLKKKYDY